MLRRVLYYQTKTDHGSPAFEVAVAGMYQALQEHFAGHMPSFESWMSADWRSPNGTGHTELWTSAADCRLKVLTVRVSLDRPPYQWHTTIRVGSSGETEAIVEEEHRPEPAEARFPITSMPCFLPRVPELERKDVDGMKAGALYSLRHERIEKLRAFLAEPATQRKLPVLIIAPKQVQSEGEQASFAVNRIQYAWLLTGLAHVVYLDAKETWGTNDLFHSCSCYAGAFRVYRPGFRPMEDARNSDFWLPFPANSLADREMDMLDKVVLYASANGDREPSLEQLTNLQWGEIAARQQQTAFAAVQANLEAENLRMDTFSQELYLAYESACAERDAIRAELSKLDGELRGLRFWRNQQNMAPEPAPMATVTAPFLTLATAAEAVYRQLDAGEQNYFCANVFPKLLDDGLRKANSEVVHFQDDGSACVFPRGGCANGRRVVYLLEGKEVRICEIYTSHDVYESARSTGWKRGDYLAASPYERSVF